MADTLEDSFKDLTASRKQIIDDLLRYLKGLEGKVVREEDRDLAFACRATADMVRSMHKDYSWRTEVIARRLQMQGELLDTISDGIPTLVLGFAVIGEAVKELKAKGEKVDKIERAVADITPTIKGIQDATKKRAEEKRREIEAYKEVEKSLQKQKEEFQDHIQ